MKIYEYNLISLCDSVYANKEILLVKRIERHKDIWSEYYQIVFQDDSWIDLDGKLPIGCKGVGVGQIYCYSLYPLNERMIKTVRKAIRQRYDEDILL